MFGGLFGRESNRNESIHQSYGYVNRSEQIQHDVTTRFGIASGCKLFTAIAISQLVEQGKLSFSTSLDSFQTFDLPHLSPNVTVHQLLTHTSGIPDYFNESVSDDLEALWRDIPMYRLQQLCDFLPLFQQKTMKDEPVARFSYNNAGYILLGLIVEEVTGQSFTDYIEQSIFQPADMTASGYFSLDALPPKTALGYIDNSDGTWRTNQYAIPSELLATYLLHNLKWELLGKTVLLPATVMDQARRAVPALNGCQSASLNRLRLALMSRSWYAPQ